MSNKIYLIKSGAMLDAIKDYIKEETDCRLAYSLFAEKFGAESYLTNGKCMYGLVLDKAPEGWTIPKKARRRSYKETWPKKNCKDYDEMWSLPKLPQQVDIIKNLTKVPLTMKYINNCGGEGRYRIGNPLNECGFLYIQSHKLYAFWLPDVQSEIEEAEREGAVVDEAIKSWKLDLQGVEEISNNKWDLLVAECKVKDEQEKLNANK